MNNPCEKMRSKIADYVLGLLNQDEIATLEEHISQCLQCKDYTESLKNEKRLLLQFGKNLDSEMDARQVKTIEALNQTSAEKTRPLSTWRIIMQNRLTKFAAAACLLFGILMWYMTIGPTSITFADVRESMAAKKWICIKFDDGAEKWMNLHDKITFYTYRNKRHFYAGMRDHVKGVRTYHHSGWAKQIHLESFEPRLYPLTAWDYATSGWNAQGSPAPDKIERIEDTLDGKAVYRFDMYYLGPAGLSAICQKVWADPKTRLPLRIQKYSSPDIFHTGDFTYPDSGPSSIHDLGVAKNLKIIPDSGMIDASESPLAPPAASLDAKKLLTEQRSRKKDLDNNPNPGIIKSKAIDIIDAAKRASKNLPKEMRIINIDTESKTFNVCYRLGDKFRRESYAPVDHTSVPQSINPPTDPEKLQQWTQKNKYSLSGLQIYDGKYGYYYNPRLSTMYVGRRTADPIFINLWPYINHVKGPMIAIDNDPETPAGCVLLRNDSPDSSRRDFYVDPKRDYICVKELCWRKDEKTNEWIEVPHSRQEHSVLSRLPSGQWYAKKHIYSANTFPSRQFNTEIHLLTDAEKKRLTELDKTTGFFDVEKLLKEAKAKKAKITFWAN